VNMDRAAGGCFLLPQRTGAGHLFVGGPSRRTRAIWHMLLDGVRAATSLAQGVPPDPAL
jgi:hypothetical protein